MEKNFLKKRVVIGHTPLVELSKYSKLHGAETPIIAKVEYFNIFLGYYHQFGECIRQLALCSSIFLQASLSKIIGIQFYLTYSSLLRMWS